MLLFILCLAVCCVFNGSLWCLVLWLLADVVVWGGLGLVLGVVIALVCLCRFCAVIC